MRFGELKSIAHNFADSISSGLCLPIGVGDDPSGDYAYNLFEDVQASPEGYIEIDFITGALSGAKPSRRISDALVRYRHWLPELAIKHGGDASEFHQLTVRFGVDRVYGEHFTVSITDGKGRSDTTIYSGGRRFAKKRNP
jgi:hypothetical protein